MRLLLLPLIAFPLVACSSSGSNESKTEWVSLFDGETTDGWRGYRRDEMPAGWQVVDGALTRTDAGGDIVTGAATVILAMGAGRRAARSMKAYLGLLEPRERALAEPGAPQIFGIDARQRRFSRLRLAS